MNVHSPAPTPGHKPGSTPMVMRIGVPEPVEWARGTLRRPGHAPAAVVAVDGPIRLSGEWWQGGFDRSYYWLTLTDGSLCWIYRDHQDGLHYLHGVAD